MMLYTCDTPILTVAEDGQTAKGVWISSERIPGGEETPVRRSYWRWGKICRGFLSGRTVYGRSRLRFYPFFLTKSMTPMDSGADI